jgi:uncharacterized membrane protein YGL010W
MSRASTPASPAPETQQAAPPQRRVDQLLAHYGESHTHPTNELIHYVAIPLIMLSLVGMMFALHPAVAYLFMGASMVYYVPLSMVFLAAMAVVAAAMLGVIHLMDAAGVLLGASVAIFVVAWVFQFIGHKIEGKKPSFFEDIQYLWVGPLFVLSKLFAKLSIRW